LTQVQLRWNEFTITKRRIRKPFDAIACDHHQRWKLILFDPALDLMNGRDARGGVFCKRVTDGARLFAQTGTRFENY